MNIHNYDLLNEKDAANFLGIKQGTLACWRSTKLVNLPYIKVGGAVRYPVDDLIKYLEANKHGYTG